MFKNEENIHNTDEIQSNDILDCADTTLKQGVLGNSDFEYIKKYASLQSVEAIARSLRRRVVTIQKYIEDNDLVSAAMTENEKQKTTLLGLLHGKDYWNEVTRQFSKTELTYFENSWVELMNQFRLDVLFSEELTIKQFITLDILLNRNLAERRQAMVDVEKLKRNIDKEYEKDDTDRDSEMLGLLESQLNFAKSSIPAYAVEYTKLLEKQKSVSTDLKANREQRIKRIEDSKSSWAGLIKNLEDEEQRETLGEEIELMRIAKDRAKYELGQYHTYMDNNIDRPLLTTDTVQDDNNDNISTE
jgi:hypothetical protein